MKKYLTPLVFGILLGLFLALLFVFLEFGGVAENFSPFAPEEMKR